MYKFAVTIFVLATVTSCGHSLTINSCSTNSVNDIIKIINVDVQPAKIQVPGNVTVTASINVMKEIDRNIQADVSIRRKFGNTWINLPCFRNIGSCTYRSVCDLLKTVIPNGCPNILASNNIPCSCPVSPGIYSVSGVSIQVTRDFLGFTIPFLAGEYKINVRLTDSISKIQSGCFDAEVEIVEPPSSDVFKTIGNILTSYFRG